MSAGTFHHKVALSLKNRKNSSAHDFNDLVDSVQNAKVGRVYCKEMNFFNFAEWPASYFSIAKTIKVESRPYVSDFTKLMFVRGRKMIYTNDFDQ